jgi:hypothetical protein
MIQITRETITKIHSLLDQGLVCGLGKPIPGRMCVEAAINYALGLPHGDDPGCVASSLRRLKIALNDAMWSSNAARAEGMRRLAIAQLGSKDVLDEALFARKCALSVAHLWKMPNIVRQYLETGDESIRVEARDIAAAAAAYAAAYAARSARSAAYAYAAARAADAVAAYAADADADVASDKVLGDFAESIVQILIEMNAPGVQWL